MSTFYICSKCGFDISQHSRFKHDIENKVEIKCLENSLFLDANQYPDTLGYKCSFPYCNAIQSLHNTKVVEHSFHNVEYKYKKINIALPDFIKCCKEGCNIDLKNHGQVLTHIFKLKLEILNRNQLDKYEIFYQDNEDLKIALHFI
jgi:hypothetical protein